MPPFSVLWTRHSSWQDSDAFSIWIPAFAGMTDRKPALLPVTLRTKSALCASTGSARTARQAQRERRDRLSANGETGSARTARQAQGERQDRHRANGKTGSARTARRAQRERRDRHRANGETGTGRTARQAQGERQDRLSGHIGLGPIDSTAQREWYKGLGSDGMSGSVKAHQETQRKRYKERNTDAALVLSARQGLRP